MKRLLMFLLIVGLTCVPAYGVESEPKASMPVQTIEANEFLSYLEENGDTVAKRRQAKEEYSNALRDLTVYTEVDLEGMGYSERTIDLVRKLRNNMDYEPTELELMTAAPTMTFYCYDFVVSTAGQYTDATFKWTFEWDARPAMRRQDCVAALWNIDGLECQEAAFEITFSDGTTYSDGDGLYDMDIERNLGEGKVCFKFPMDSDNSLAWCESGRGEFRLHLNSRITAIQIAWGYGHQTVAEVTGITVSWGYLGAEFGEGYERLCGAVRTYYVN